MKTKHFIALGIVICIGIAALSYGWATGLMDSLFAFRSPLANNPPASGEPVGPPQTRQAVLVLIDALRYDTSMKADVMPFLNELRAQGASARMHSQAPSYSAPGYTVLMTGAWPDLSDGPTMNPDAGQLPRTWTQDNLFSAAHRAGLRTAVSGYFWFQGLIPQEAVDASFYTQGEDAAADREVLDAALPWLGEDYQLVLIHIDQVDYAGHHEGGPRSPNWDAAATRADDMLRAIAAALDLSQDTLIIFSDHGQLDKGGHGGQDPVVLLEPFVMAGAGVKPGQYDDIQMVDLAPTVASLLGTNIPASSQGEPQLDMFETLPPGILAAEQQQGKQLAGAYSTAMRVNASPTASLDHPGRLSDIQFLKAQRLRNERIPRSIIAIVLLLISAAFLLRLKGRAAAWARLAALLYMLLFNLYYAFIAGRTYSLSSVGGVDDIILSTAGTASMALLLCWLLLAVAARLDRGSPSEAAWTTMVLVLTSLFFLAIPMLYSYALNGALITWTLPDMLSMFVGFLSILQALIVAAAGILLTGLAALLTLVASRWKVRFAE